MQHRNCPALQRHAGLVCRIPHSTHLGRPPHRTVLVPLPCVKPGGGGVPRMVVLLQRKYPPCNWQRTSDGRAAVLTPKAHAAALRMADSRAAKVSHSVGGTAQNHSYISAKYSRQQGSESPLKLKGPLSISVA